MEKSKRVLITGVSGFVGSAVASRLIARGMQTFGITRTDLDHPSMRIDGLEVYQCQSFSRLELESVLQSVKPHAIIHLAAAGVTSRGKDADELLGGNVEFTINLVRAAADCGCLAMLHTGSCFEYSVAKGRNLTEQDLVQPFSLYGATKAASVQLAIGLAREYQLPLVVLRLFGVYGPGEAPQRLVPTLMRGLASYKPIELTSGTQERDWLYIEDAAEAFCTALVEFEHMEQHTVYNVCSGVATSVRHFGESIALEMRRPTSLLQWGAMQSRHGEPTRIVGDPTLFQTATGWSPRFNLQLGIRTTVQDEMLRLQTAA